MRYQAPYGVTDPNAGYINGNPAAGIEGSIPPAAAFEQPLRELDSLIKAATFTPADSDLQQVARSVRQGVNYLVGTAVGGNVNALAAVTPPTAPPLAQYKVGLRLDIKIPADNTGPVTLAVDTLMAVQVVRCNGAILQAGDLVGGMIVELIYDGTRFQTLNFRGFTATTSNENTYIVNLPYAADSSPTVNVITAAYTPAITAIQPGTAVLCKLAHTLTGSSTFAPNALPAAPVVRANGAATMLNDAWIGEILLLLYDGAKWQICNGIGLPAPILTANANWYVNANLGNDGYDGTSPTVLGTTKGPFRTITRGVNETLKYNMNGYSQYINVADGGYNEMVGLPTTNGAGTIYVRGNPALPANCQLTCPNAFLNCCFFQTGGNYDIEGFRLSTPPAALDCLVCALGTMRYRNLQFGPAARFHINAEGSGCAMWSDGGQIIIEPGANALAHITAADNGFHTVPVTNIPSLLVNGAVNFARAFVWAGGLGRLNSAYTSTPGSGAVTGKQYFANGNGVLTGGPWPGDQVGTLETGGQYL